MRLYVDASAIVAWLLGEDRSPSIVDSLGGAESLCTSRLTLVECDRALLRCAHEGRLNEVERAELSALAATAAAHWSQLAVTESVLDRARLPFRDHLVRTLDAIHLASALAARSAIPGLAILTLDDRMRHAGRALGFAVVPE